MTLLAGIIVVALLVAAAVLSVSCAVLIVWYALEGLWDGTVVRYRDRRELARIAEAARLRRRPKRDLRAP